MQVQCRCGKFQGLLPKLPGDTAGRLKCYCDDCQNYLIHLDRTDLLDKNGGTEIVAVYPKDFVVEKGEDYLACLRLSASGPYRWYTTCCHSPVANTRAKVGWLGVFANVFNDRDPQYLSSTLGNVKSAIMGKYAKGTVPDGTAATFNFKAFATVGPFMLKAFFKKAYQPSPFFQSDGTTSAKPLRMMTDAERQRLEAKRQSIRMY